MSWNELFIDQLARFGTKEPRYLVETILVATELNLMGGVIRLSSHYESVAAVQCIARTGHSFSPAALQPGEWSSTYGELRIALTGGFDVRNLPSGMAVRGQPVQFKVGFRGWSIADYAPVFSGHVQGIGRSGDQWYISIKSGMAALVNRFTATTGHTALFYDHPNTPTVLSADYTAGNATINVGSNTYPEKETGAKKYVIQITPTSGSPFWVTATGKGTGTFTGCSAAGILGTTAVDAVSGDLVTPFYHVEDHPVNIARKVIASTGAGTNGDYDTLPASWGIGLVDSFLDHDDMDTSVELIGPNVGTTYWNVIGNEAEESGLDWMQSWLNSAGMFITDRQGQITVRGGLNAVNWHYDLEVVTDADIVDIEEYETWDLSQNVEYDSMDFKFPGGSAGFGEDLTSRPIVGGRTRSLDFIDQNTANWPGEINDRIGPWDMRLAETVTLKLGGWRFAKLAPGSHIVISSKFFTTRSGMINQSFLVKSVEPDWFGSSTRIVAAHIPENSWDL